LVERRVPTASCSPSWRDPWTRRLPRFTRWPKTANQEHIIKFLKKKLAAFTLVELLVVLAMVLLLAARLLPALAGIKTPAERLVCARNLKQVGQAFNVWAPAYADRYPMQVPASQGGPPNASTFQTSLASGVGKTRTISPNAAFMHQVFGVMSNQLSTPKTVICPADEREATTNFYFAANHSSAANSFPAEFNNNYISYFVGLDASQGFPQMLLSGDRNIYYTQGGSTTLPTQYPGNGYGYAAQNGAGGSYVLGTNWVAGTETPCWTIKMHQTRGNALLPDGSVQQLTSLWLRNQLQNSGDKTMIGGPNCLMFP
jgi:type II secretory pathway pseudopilin PulG